MVYFVSGYSLREKGSKVCTGRKSAPQPEKVCCLSERSGDRWHSSPDLCLDRCILKRWWHMCVELCVWVISWWQIAGYLFIIMNLCTFLYLQIVHCCRKWFSINAQWQGLFRKQQPQQMGAQVCLGRKHSHLSFCPAAKPSGAALHGTLGPTWWVHQAPWRIAACQLCQAFRSLGLTF